MEIYIKGSKRRRAEVTVVGYCTTQYRVCKKYTIRKVGQKVDGQCGEKMRTRKREKRLRKVHEERGEGKSRTGRLWGVAWKGMGKSGE